MGFAHTESGDVVLSERTTGNKIRGTYAGFSAKETQEYPGIYVEYLHLRTDGGDVLKLPMKAYEATTVIGRPIIGKPEQTAPTSQETPHA